MSERDDLRVKLERIAADEDDPDAAAWAQGVLAMPKEPSGADRINAAIRQAAQGSAGANFRDRMRRRYR